MWKPPVTTSVKKTLSDEDDYDDDDYDDDDGIVQF